MIKSLRRNVDPKQWSAHNTQVSTATLTTLKSTATCVRQCYAPLYRVATSALVMVTYPTARRCACVPAPLPPSPSCRAPNLLAHL